MKTYYKSIKVAGKKYQLHRYVMECHLGHPVPAGFAVHHKNGDKTDNRIENLEVISYQGHAELHNQKHPREKTCENCGATYAPKATKRKRSKTCSEKCWHELVVKIQRKKLGIEERDGVLWKPCHLCGQVLPWDEEHFHRERRSPVGLGSACKPCTRARNNARKQAKRNAQGLLAIRSAI